jgi:hypothetical protein
MSCTFLVTYLYYWFSVGEGTLPLHHLIAQNTPRITYVEKKNQFTSINSGTHGKKYWYSRKEIAIAIMAITAIALLLVLSW